MYCQRSFEKVDYSIISTPDEECTWYYSYLELQNKLNVLCKKHTLKKVYGGLLGYLESQSYDKNYYDFSYLGGPLILIFDNIAIELCVHGVGMIQCREMNLWDVKIRNIRDSRVFDLNLFDDKYFYDLGKEFELQYEEQQVTEVVVDRTDSYPFDLTGFDEEKAKMAELANSLPNHIHFKLANGVDFGVCADEIEYFYVELKN